MCPKENVAVHVLFDQVKHDLRVLTAEFLSTPGATYKDFQDRFEEINQKRPKFQLPQIFLSPEETSTKLYMENLRKKLESLNKGKIGS